MNVTKLELCSSVAKKYNMEFSGTLSSIIDYKNIFDIFVDEIIMAMSEGSRIELRGFGCFKPTTRKIRTVSNPRTGEMVDIPAYSAPYFKFSKEAQKIFDEKIVEYQSKISKKPEKIQITA